MQNDWLPFKEHDKRNYHELTTEEKKLRQLESINRNIRFFAILTISGLAIVGVYSLFLLYKSTAI